jgi:phosphoserine phosphatase RsbU/P
MATPRKSTEAFRERAELLDFLLEVSRVTSETLDLDRLLASVAGIVKVVTPYDLFAIFLYNDKTHGLHMRYAIGHREELVRSLVIGLAEGVVGAAAESREPVMVDDVRIEPRYLNALDAVRSELAVPMMARGRLVGVIDLQSTRLRAYSDHDRRIMRLIASRVGSSIENARLYRRVDRQNRTLRTLSQLSQEFSSILDLDELLGKIAASVRTLIDYDAFSILLVDVENRVLRHRFSVRYDQRVDLDNIPLGKGITGAAAESRQAVRVVNTQQDPRYIATDPGSFSEIAVPLILQDRVVGVLNVESEPCRCSRPRSPVPSKTPASTPSLPSASSAWMRILRRPASCKRSCCRARPTSVVSKSPFGRAPRATSPATSTSSLSMATTTR